MRAWGTWAARMGTFLRDIKVHSLATLVHSCQCVLFPKEKNLSGQIFDQGVNAQLPCG